MKFIPELLMLIGRISISSVFIISAFIKVIDYGPTAGPSRILKKPFF
nr:hypothetical protein [Chlamydiota bacterium]